MSKPWRIERIGRRWRATYLGKHTIETGRGIVLIEAMDGWSMVKAKTQERILTFSRDEAEVVG